MQTNLGTKLSIINKIQLKIFGIVSTKKRTKPGWKGELMYYAFICPIHGLVEDYPHGFEQRLKCPLCGLTEARTSQSSIVL